MFGWLKREKRPATPPPLGLHAAAEAFFKASVAQCDKKSSVINKGLGMDYVPLLQTVAELDELSGSNDNIQELTNCCLEAFSKGNTVEQCGAMFGLMHMKYTSKLEDLHREALIRGRSVTKGHRR